jgi:3-dehydroquinate synthase
VTAPAGEPVVVRRGALEEAGAIAREHVRAHRWALVTDDTVGPLYADRVRRSFGDARVDLLTMPAGEAHKTRDTWAALTDRMLLLGLGRDCAVVALGGGVVGDLAGFVAATFMRGVPVVQLPTTLLAMIDASIGGKTGVDTPAGKNLVGAFHRPAVVIADPAALATLPARQLRAGLAEAIKHGIIADASYLEQTVAALPELLGERGAERESMEALVRRSIEIKQATVARDEREAGLRRILNFGHTLGHALELASGWSLLHGEAVAIGMVLEAEAAERAGVADAGTAARVRASVLAAGLPGSRPAEVDAEAVLAATRGDKKVRAGTVEYALPARIGAMAGGERGWSVPLPDALVRQVLA